MTEKTSKPIPTWRYRVGYHDGSGLEDHVFKTLEEAKQYISHASECDNYGFQDILVIYDQVPIEAYKAIVQSIPLVDVYEKEKK